MISTHILDTSRGHPAAQVQVTLEKKSGDDWKQLFVEKTNADGRINFECPKEPGIYRLTFDIENYFKTIGQESFFQNTPVIFQVTDIKRKYHVPLLLNPFGYSTYRGS